MYQLSLFLKKNRPHRMAAMKLSIEEMSDLNINIKYEWHIYLSFIVLYILIHRIFLFHTVLKKKLTIIQSTILPVDFIHYY